MTFTLRGPYRRIPLHFRLELSQDVLKADLTRTGMKLLQANNQGKEGMDP
jgi:hypothetical protein